MRILDRFILAEFIRFFLIILFSLMMIFFIADYLRGVWDAEVSAFVLLKYTAFQIPHILCNMVGPAAMLATMITLSSLNRKNELTAMFATGISLAHVAFLVFGVIFISSCITLVTLDRVVPPLARQRIVYFWKTIKGRQDFSLDIRTTKIWYRSNNYIYNLRLFDKKTSSIQGIGIYYFGDGFKLIQHVEGQSANFDEKQSEWVLKKGILTIFPETDTFPLSKSFEEKKLKLPETPKDFLEIEKQVETLRLKDLWAFIKRNKEAGIDTKIYEIDFHSRLVMSFVPLIMGLIAVPYSVRPRRQGGVVKDIAVCVGWIFCYWLLYSISLSLGRSGAISTWASVWTLPVTFLGAAFFLVLKG